MARKTDKPLPSLSAFPITPFDSHGTVDTRGLRVLLERCLEANVPSIGLLGSTGSYAYLTRKGPDSIEDTKLCLSFGLKKL